MRKYWEEDPLKLSPDQWLGLLLDPYLFSERDLQGLVFIFRQPKYRATATEVGLYLGLSQQKVTSDFRTATKKIMVEQGTPTFYRDNGKRSYWHFFFLEADERPAYCPTHDYWVLRPPLKEALAKYCAHQEIGLSPQETLPNLLDEREDVLFLEGERASRLVNRYERSGIGRAKCLAHYGGVCQICGLNPEIEYGTEFARLIEVHHIKPLSQIGESYLLNPIKDLLAVCPNCHRMLHSKPGGIYSPAQLRKKRNHE